MVSETCICDKQIIGGAEFQQSLSTVKCATGRTNNNQQLILQTTFRAGTWNVRGMNRPGKVENIVSEAAAMQLDVCGLTETHWTQSGEMTI